MLKNTRWFVSSLALVAMVGIASTALAWGGGSPSCGTLSTWLRLC